MTIRGSMTAVGVIAAVALAGCGQPASGPGASGRTSESSLEPIDAVPLPLDDNPLTPPPVAEPAPKAEVKSDDKAEVEPDAADPSTSTASAAAEKPQITPSAATIEPAPRPRIAPAPREASPTPPEKREPERPVLNF